MENFINWAYLFSLLLVLLLCVYGWRKLTRQFTIIITRHLSDQEAQAINRFIQQRDHHANQY